MASISAPRKKSSPRAMSGTRTAPTRASEPWAASAGVSAGRTNSDRSFVSRSSSTGTTSGSGLCSNQANATVRSRSLRSVWTSCITSRAVGPAEAGERGHARKRAYHLSERAQPWRGGTPPQLAEITIISWMPARLRSRCGRTARSRGWRASRAAPRPRCAGSSRQARRCARPAGLR